MSNTKRAKKKPGLVRGEIAGGKFAKIEHPLHVEIKRIANGRLCVAMCIPHPDCNVTESESVEVMQAVEEFASMMRELWSVSQHNGVH